MINIKMKWLHFFSKVSHWMGSDHSLQWDGSQMRSIQISNTKGIEGHEWDLIKWWRDTYQKKKMLKRQYLCTKAIFPRINGQPQLLICFNRITPIILKVVSTKLVAQTNSSTFMSTEIDQYTPTCCLNLLHCKCQLVSTVTSGWSKYVSSETLRMYPHKNILPIPNLALFILKH